MASGENITFTITQDSPNAQMNLSDKSTSPYVVDIIFNDDSSVTFVLSNGKRYRSDSLKGDKGDKGDPGVGGDYDTLEHLPTINSVTVQGDKTSSDYNLQSKMQEASIAEIESILYLD